MEISPQKFDKLYLSGNELIAESVHQDKIYKQEFRFVIKTYNTEICIDTDNTFDLNLEFEKNNTVDIAWEKIKKSLDDILEEVSKVCKCQKDYKIKVDDEVVRQFSWLEDSFEKITFYVKFVKTGDIFSMFVFEIEYECLDILEKFQKKITEKDEEIKVLKDQVAYAVQTLGEVLS